VGPKPVGVAVAGKRNLLIAADYGLDTVFVVDLTGKTATRRIESIRTPYFVAITPDESLALVGNLLPQGPANDLSSAAGVTLVDLESIAKVGQVVFPDGSSNVRKLTISAEGRRAYVPHTIGQVSLPTIQIHHGWVNTNAISIIDLAERERYATFLVDRLQQGGADPWSAVVSGDGESLWVTLAGVHQLARVDLGQLHALLAGSANEEVYEQAMRADISSRMNLWSQIRRYPASREFLHYDLAALPAAGLLERYDLPVKGPRGLALSPDGQLLAVAAYFSGELLLIETDTGNVCSRIVLRRGKTPNLVRRGEILFHDATLALETWLSCATCHPEGGRADGLNWDLTNDGQGNPKNGKSLLFAHKTPPAMATGVRSDFGVAVEAGIRHILYQEPRADDVKAIEAYVRSLRPEGSPHLIDGELSELAEKGKAVFQDRSTGCSRCHPPPLFTDLQTHNVGTHVQLDLMREFDTPSLVELWRTGPYLHSGAAVTVREVLTKFNPENRHGKTSHLSPHELDALVEYLQSL
jgi:mono/diheme cytochrome c family protein